MTADEIVALYRGSSDKNQQLKNLVDLAQLPLSEIVGILTAAGCKVEPGWKEMMPMGRSGRKGGGKHGPKLSPDQAETIRRWYWEDGLSCVKIGERLGASDNAVRTFMLKNNIPVRQGRGGDRRSKAASAPVQGSRSDLPPAPVEMDFAWAESRLDMLLTSMAKRDLLSAGMAAGELRQWLRERSK